MSFVHPEALESARRWLRAGQDVHVIGDAGSGRTTVLRALGEALRGAGCPVVELPGVAGGQAVPLRALLVHPSLRPRATVPRWGAAEAASALAEELAGRGATVLVDDVHLLDAASLAVVGTVARQRPDGIRVVTSVPPGTPADAEWSGLARGSAAVRLTPLGVTGVAALLADRLGGQVEGSLAAMVTGRSAGNPRAAVALALAAAGSGAVAQVRGRWAQVGNLEAVPTESVLHGLLDGLPGALRDGLDALAWFGLLDVDHAKTLLGVDRLAALDAAGRIAVDERSDARLVAVTPPVLAQALRARLSGARRAMLRARAEELFGASGSAGGDGDDAGRSRLVALAGMSPDDRPVHQQVAVVIESVRTRAALWAGRWAQRHDVASALPLLRLTLVDGLAHVDVDEIFAGTLPTAGDNAEQVASYAVLRGQWAAQQGGTVRDGLVRDPGPSARLVVDGLGESFLRYLDQAYDGPGRAPDATAIDMERDVPPAMGGYATVQRLRTVIEAGDPDRALDLLGSWQGSDLQRPYTHRMDALRGDALLLAGQVDDAVDWGRGRLSAAYDELSPVGIRLAARGLATALFLKGDDDRALRALSVVLRLGRIGVALSPYDERIFGIAAVLHARAGNHDLARMMLDELEATARPFAPVLDFMRPWARLEVAHAAAGGVPDGEPMWAAGEDLWAQGWVASAVFCWALTPQRLSHERLARLESGFAATHVPLLLPAVRLHRHLAHGTSGVILESVRAMRTRGPLAHVAVARAQELTKAEGRTALTVEDLAESVGVPASTVRASGRPAAGLTAREAEIVALAREGLTNREIASRLFLSVRTVESHLYRAMQKLGVSDRRQLVR
ncbi:LuxR C-terminal-related transcriptional regulator [Isoptericola sp. NEAU-Y5]|uniref:LuxR C-terminal-related transcriptional regulator n=1 Tax=Isoptericola luteus TaxID=2879484 RepID=A0ABS7ZAP1_9MICO|nr:LuxR C-terminal-related transcriptional regulator [Isoptericola sp. NEAU-Y5]MCA5892128.1 LuxR C-terminal-related transcriptional regulator [Isoptericola sp. NEAU-Y5]